MPLQLSVMRDMSRRALGQWAEQQAARYLQQQGFIIRAQNWQGKAGELDLIVERDDLLLVVEVRARRSQTYGSPEASITIVKAQRLITLTYQYLAACEAAGTPWQGNYRIDVIAITLDRYGRLENLHHVQAAIEE